MLTAESALRWELRSALRLRLLGVFCLLLLVPGLTLIPNFERQARGIEIPIEEMHTSPGIHLTVTVINLIMCLFGVGQAIGMSVRQYSLPIPTHLLATTRLISGAACCSGLYLVLSTLFNVVFRANWPVIGPALTYGVAYMVMYSTVYRFRGNETRIGVAGLIMGMIVLFWVGGHYGTRWWVVQSHPWPDLSVSELLILLLVGYAAWRSLVNAMVCDRRGAGWGRTIERSPVASVAARSVPARQFRSAVSALFWQDWRQDGWLVPIVTVGVLAISAVMHVSSLFLFEEFRRDTPIHGPPIVASLMGFLPLCFILPWFLGLSGQHGKRAAGNRPLPTAHSTLPLSDAAFGWICLARVIASSLLAAAGVALVGVLWYGGVELVVRIYDIPVHVRPLSEVDAPPVYPYIAINMLILWLVSGFSTAATLTGRRRIAILPLMIIPTWIGLVAIGAIMGRLNEIDGIVRVLAFSLVAIALGWIVVAYIAGIMLDLISYRTLIAGFLLLIVSESIGICILEPQRALFTNSISPTAYNMWLMCIALTTAPPALIPLATYYNRHR